MKRSIINNRFTPYHLLSFLLMMMALLSLNSCSNTRYLAKEENLLISNQISIESEQKMIDKGTVKYDLLTMATPKPNKKMLGLARLRLWFHNRTKNKQKGLRAWLYNNIAEPPALLDSTRLEQSAERMSRYLFDKGYFHNKVSFKTSIKNQKAQVSYTAKLQKPYQLGTITFPKDTTRAINQLIGDIASESLLEKGKQFTTTDLKEERNRITYHLRSQGYFDLKSTDVYFKLDSSDVDRSVNVAIDVRPPKENEDHGTYRINKVYILPQYYPAKDSVFYTDTTLINGYHYITPEKKRYKPKAITDYLLIKSGELYSQKNYDYALNHLIQLGAFKFVSIKFSRTDKGGEKPDTEMPSDTLLAALPAIPPAPKSLDCFVFLTPRKPIQMSAEGEVNNRSKSAISPALVGTAVSFTNKNILRGTQILALNVYSGLEFDLERNPSLINTVDMRGELSITFPRFITPFKVNRVFKFYRPKTSLSLGYDYIRRVQFYTLNSTNLSFGYDWRQSNRKRHIFNPIAVSLVSLSNTTPDFDDILLQNTLLERRFQERLILGGNYTFFYNSRTSNLDRNFFLFRGNIDVSGNIAFLLDETLRNASLSDGFEILGNKYAQYTRFDADFRQYHVLSRSKSLVWRLAGSVGLPYGNSDVLPYIKQYFVGGNNSLRAFAIRSIGPGSLTSRVQTINEFDRIGNLKFEANMEYRFDIWSYFKGALFADFGNIWTLDKDTTRLGGQFKAKSFLEDLGVGVGAGLRLDFSYFILRFDVGARVRNPSLPKFERWAIRNWKIRNLHPNLAIGYPF